MSFFTILIITIVLVVIAVLALSIRLLFTKKGDFRGGSCSTRSDELTNRGISCGCGHTESCR